MTTQKIQSGGPFKYETLLVVEGKGEFPIDMLRYDNCIPAREQDANEILNCFYGPGAIRRVCLRKLHHDPKPILTERRWESFGWRVMEEHEVNTSRFYHNLDKAVETENKED